MAWHCATRIGGGYSAADVVDVADCAEMPYIGGIESLRSVKIATRISSLTVREICALSNLDNIAVRVADVAAYLTVLWNRLGDELRSSAFP